MERVLHVFRAPVGGLFRHVRDLATAQAACGLDVGIVCDSSTGDVLTDRRLDDVRPALTLGLSQVPMSRHAGWRDLTAYAAIRDIAIDRNITVLHGHGAKGGAYARLAAAALRASGRDVRAIYTPHGGSLHYSPTSALGRLYLGLERLLAPMTDAIIFESAFALRVFTQKVGADVARSVVIPNGVLPSELITAPVSDTAADLLYVGELRHLKGVDVLLEAIARVRKQRSVTAVLVGAGPDADQFKAQATVLEIDDAVQFPGTMPARAAFPLGRILVVPSRAESFPYIVLEAAAAGKPIIASDVGGIPEIVAGTPAVLLPPADSGALASAISAHLDDQAGTARTATKLQARVAAEFTVARMTQAVIDCYAACRVVSPERDARTPPQALKSASHH